MSQMTFDGFIDPPSTEKKVEATGRVLSHSSISLYRACPQKWKFRYIDKVPEKPKSFFSFGKSVHAGLEYLFDKSHMVLPSMEALIQHYKDHWISEGYESGPQEKWFYQEGERILKGFYSKHNKEHANIFQIEYKFNIAIEGVPVTGFIDRIDTTTKGGLSIVDYKTGKAFDKSRVRTDAQLTLYQLAVQEVFKKPVETVTLYHLNSLTPLTVPAHSKKMEEDLKQVVLSAAEGIKAEKFDPKPDERGQCQWCDYLQICPAFAGKKTALRAGLSSLEMAEKVDALGKLDERLRELESERADLSKELGGFMKVQGQTELKGRHFVARSQEAQESGESKISTSPVGDNVIE